MRAVCERILVFVSLCVCVLVCFERVCVYFRRFEFHASNLSPVIVTQWAHTCIGSECAGHTRGRRLDCIFRSNPEEGRNRDSFKSYFLAPCIVTWLQLQEECMCSGYCMSPSLCTRAYQTLESLHYDRAACRVLRSRERSLH
jgi:hypothetical protein